jgi:hypothetical protein
MPRRKNPTQPEEPEDDEWPRPEQSGGGDSQRGERVWGDWRESRRAQSPDIPDISEFDTAVLTTREVLAALEDMRWREIDYHEAQAKSLREAAAALAGDIERARQLEAALAARYRLVLVQPPTTVGEMETAKRWLEELGAAQVAFSALEQQQRALEEQANAHERAATQLRRVTHPPRRS